MLFKFRIKTFGVIKDDASIRQSYEHPVFILGRVGCFMTRLDQDLQKKEQ
jgi:hypothetical protein